ncbi:hypothetical protein VRK_08690 [Vibrio sp. MEBiC08052]|nr:hypothetical protein VRK_08690 [Vibrio sp. MEBiC08052]
MVNYVAGNDMKARDFKIHKKNDANGCVWCYITKIIPL